MMDRRTLQSCAYVAVALGGGIPILYLPNILGLSAHGAGDPQTVIGETVCTAGGIAWACVFAVLGFRRAEEFVQERSKFAWYWGSLIGIAAATPVFVFVGLGGLGLIDPAAAVGRDVARAFSLGLALPLAAQVLGFAGVSLWWRATKR